MATKRRAANLGAGQLWQIHDLMCAAGLAEIDVIRLLNRLLGGDLAQRLPSNANSGSDLLMRTLVLLNGAVIEGRQPFAEWLTSAARRAMPHVEARELAHFAALAAGDPDGPAHRPLVIQGLSSVDDERRGLSSLSPEQRDTFDTVRAQLHGLFEAGRPKIVTLVGRHAPPVPRPGGEAAALGAIVAAVVRQWAVEQRPPAEWPSARRDPVLDDAPFRDIAWVDCLRWTKGPDAGGSRDRVLSLLARICGLHYIGCWSEEVVFAELRSRVSRHRTLVVLDQLDWDGENAPRWLPQLVGALSVTYLIIPSDGRARDFHLARSAPVSGWEGRRATDDPAPLDPAEFGEPQGDQHYRWWWAANLDRRKRFERQRLDHRLADRIDLEVRSLRAPSNQGLVSETGPKLTRIWLRYVHFLWEAGHVRTRLTLGVAVRDWLKARLELGVEEGGSPLVSGVSDLEVYVLTCIDGLGWVYLMQHDLARAAEVIEEGVTRLGEPQDGETAEHADLRAFALLRRAQLFLAQGQLCEAHKTLDEARPMASFPHLQAAISRTTGRLARASGRWQDAVEAFSWAARWELTRIPHAGGRVEVAELPSRADHHTLLQHRRLRYHLRSVLALAHMALDRDDRHRAEAHLSPYRVLVHDMSPLVDELMWEGHVAATAPDGQSDRAAMATVDGGADAAGGGPPDRFRTATRPPVVAAPVLSVASAVPVADASAPASPVPCADLLANRLPPSLPRDHLDLLTRADLLWAFGRLELENRHLDQARLFLQQSRDGFRYAGDLKRLGHVRRDLARVDRLR